MTLQGKIRAAVEKEREECAKICETVCKESELKWLGVMHDPSDQITARDCAFRIRNRGKRKK